MDYVVVSAELYDRVVEFSVVLTLTTDSSMATGVFKWQKGVRQGSNYYATYSSVN